MGQRARTALREGARALWAGALPGVLLYVGLFGLCLAVHRSTEYMGVEDKALTSGLIALFQDEIIAQQLAFLLTYVLIGAIVGLAAYGWLALARHALGRGERPWRPWRRFLGTLALAFVIHGWFLARSAGHYPALYAPQTEASTLLAVAFWVGVDLLPAWLLSALGWLFVLSAAAMGGWLMWSRGEAGTPPAALTDRRRLLLGGLAGGVAVALIVHLASGPSLPTRAPDAPPGRPNVLLIAVDSLRGDIVGGPDGITPNIDAFASRGTRFANAYTVMPRTFPAWASIATGQFPHHHGVRHMFPDGAASTPVAGSLARVLRDAGYRTAVITDSAGEVFSRRDFGYEHTDAPTFTLRSNVQLGGAKLHVHLMPYLADVLEGATAPELHANERLGDPEWLTTRAMKWLSQPDERPFFLTLFYSAGHFPFAAPDPWYRRYTDPDYRGRSRFHKQTFGHPLPGAAAAAEEAQIRGLYLGALGASDAAIGRLLDALDAAGTLEDTVVVLTADHGENVYEHGLGVGHGDHLYALATLHVPLVMVWPGMEGRRLVVDEAVRTIDIAPTLLGQLGLAPTVAPDGVDLRPRMFGQAPPTPLPAFAETGLWFYPPETKRLDGRRIQFVNGLAELLRPDPRTWEIHVDPRYADTVIMAKHRMLLADGRKLLYIPTRDGVRFELYDPWGDPDETRELSAAEPERLAAMKAQLYEWLLSDPEMVRVGDFALPRRTLGREPTAAAK